MAGINRESGGTFTATWKSADGQRVAISTGEVVIEKAAKKAAEMEAEARFWEDHVQGNWQRLANAPFSPRYLHNVFTCARHLPFPKFRRLLNEAGVKFVSPSSWRDSAKAKGRKSGLTWRFKGKLKTIDELMQDASDGVTLAAVRHRLSKGWEIDQALSTPLMSRSEAGTKGATKTNNHRCSM